MHDEPIERRLRAALQDEAGRLPLTITAAELERRAVLRGRGGSRRLTLLLAAALAIGTIGLGGAMGGLLDRNTTADASVPPSSASETRGPAEPGPSPTYPRIGPAPVVLPDLDSLVAGAGGDRVVYASAHGSADGSAALPAGMQNRVLQVNMGSLDPDTRYELQATCLGTQELVFDLRAPGDNETPASGPVVDCDGGVTVVPFSAPEARTFQFRTNAPSSWRVLVRRLDDPQPPGTGRAPVLDPEVLTDVLARGDNLVVGTDEPAPGPNGLVLQQVGAVPVRESYRVMIWCAGGGFVRAINGNQVQGQLRSSTVTQMPCDNREHTATLAVPEPTGTSFYVEATPRARWTILLGAPVPPVAMINEEPGWTFSSGYGPAFSFEAETHSFTGPGDQNGGGPTRVTLACAGLGDIEVLVELFAPMGDGEADATFTAECGMEPSTTSVVFEDAEEYLTVTWTSAPEQWTALSLLMRDP